MVDVPAVTPVSVPAASMVATAVLELLHTPPLVALLNTVVLPTTIDAEPEMLPAPGVVCTVTMTVAAALPQVLVTV